MADPGKTHDGLTQIQAAVKFLSSLSGIMAGATAVLPFAGQLTEFVDDSFFKRISPGMVTTMSSLVSCYMLMYLVNSRDDIRARPQRKVRRQSATRLILAFALFTLYVMVIEESVGGTFEQWWAMVFYAGFFVCAMYAFALVGLKEFVGHQPSPDVP